MRRIMLIVLITVTALCAGCNIPTNSTPELTSATKTPIPTSVGPIGPFDAEWEFVDSPVISTENLQIAIYAIGLDSQNTIVLYSVTGLDAADFLKSEANIQIRDNSGKTIEFLSITPIAHHDQIHFGVMRFEPRPQDSSELFLKFDQDSDEANINEVPIVRFREPPENPSTYNSRTYLLSIGETLEQSNYKIEFTGWIAPPSSVLTATQDLSESSTVRRKATLLLDDMGTNTIYYIYVKFDSNWNATGTLINK